MKDEIKEILEALKPHNDNVKEYPLTLSIKQQKILLDYITNLQNGFKSTVEELCETTEELEGYKQEIERLRAREQECIDKYLNMSKYASKMEGKYIIAKSIIDELEKWLKDVDIFQMNFIENKEHITPYKTVLDKLKELKEGK